MPVIFGSSKVSISREAPNLLLTKLRVLLALLLVVVTLTALYSLSLSDGVVNLSGGLGNMTAGAGNQGQIPNPTVKDSVSNLSSANPWSGSVTTMSIGMSIGEPSVAYENFTGVGSVKFPAAENFPVWVSTDPNCSVRLSATSVPSGVWVSFAPSLIDNVGPKGMTTTLVVVGAVKPLVPTRGNFTINLVAAGSNGARIVVKLTLVQVWRVSIVSSPISIDYPGVWELGSTGSWFQVYGVVYDPPNQTIGPVSVGFQVLGLIQSGEIAPLPSWLQVGFPASELTLQAGSPSYFTVDARTSSAQPGRYMVAVQESAGGQTSIVDLDVVVAGAFNT